MITYTVIFPFKICDKVKIIPLEKLIGRVTAIWISNVGTQYQVRYFFNGEEKSVYFFEDELILIV